MHFMTRRDLLRVGSLGLGNLGLAELLRHEAHAAADRRRPSRLQSRIQSVILIQHYGAPSHIDLWDPKPHAPAEIRGEFSTIPTSLPGFRVTEIMPRLSQWCHKLSMIRSMTHRIANHNPATYLAITGHTPERDAVQVGATPTDWPAYGAAAARFNPGSGRVPPAVQIPHVAFDQVYKCPGQWGGFLGKRYDPLIVIGDPNDPNYRTSELSLSADLTLDRLQDRRSLLRSLDHYRNQHEHEALLPHAGLDQYYQRAYSILTSRETQQAFDLSREPTHVRDRYGRNKYGQCYLLTRRLVEAGVRFVTCFNGSNPGDGWDTHADNFQRLRNQLMPPDDQGFSALLEDLESRGLADSTLVIWAGEFGRKPHIAQAGATFVGAAGRDHWPQCYTVVFFGGGTRQGFLYGSSDRFAAYPQENATTPADLAATIYHALGIDPQAEVHDQQGRPLLLTSGTPVRALWT